MELVPLLGTARVGEVPTVTWANVFQRDKYSGYLAVGTWNLIVPSGTNLAPDAILQGNRVPAEVLQMAFGACATGLLWPVRPRFIGPLPRA